MLVMLFTIGSGNAWGAVTALTIPKAWGTSDGKSAYTEALGCSNTSCLGSDYSSAPKLKFDGQGDYIIIQIASAPAYVTFNIKGSSSGWSGTFKVQESADNKTYEDAASYTSLSNSSTSKTVSLKASTRYIKFIFSSKTTGYNVGLGGVTIKARTSVTLDKNSGDADGSAVFAFNATAYESFTAATRAGYTCTGYWTATSGGTKVLKADGTYATSSVSNWLSGSKWAKDAATGTLYAQWEAAAACAADVAIGTASLNGTFNLSSVGVQCASITPGSNCAVASGDYGFIWYEGTGNKEIGGSGVTRVNNSGAYSSGAFSNSLTSTFVAGTTYTFRAFAINGKPSTAYSAAVSFTPYTVTFNMNGHGSAIAQQVVNTGGTASTPSAPSATGYTFGGWYQEAGCTNAVNWSSTITANKNYYAKWTAKEYTVTLDNESPTVSGSTSVTLTYNSASHADITNPTKTGYTFAGWWTADNGTGTEVINTSGVLQANVSNYTGVGGIWTRDNNSTTLYAKWTAKSFTVTWMVNGVAYTTGDPSGSVDFGTHVAKLPTAPTPPCGNKFMGWTTTNIGSVGIDKANTSAITALNLFTTAGDAPTISAEGNVTYYAVFADYGE